MREALLRRWAHAPWHCWIKESPVWLDLFAELWARLPESALRKIFLTTRALVLLPPVQYGRVVRIERPLMTGAFLMQLDAKLLERSRAEALGILAHEFAHLCAPTSDDDLANDLEADRLARSWGFSAELDQALRQDLGTDHPRVRAIATAA